MHPSGHRYRRPRTKFGAYLPKLVSMRIGIFGGTFDPVHHAHLLVASDVRAALSLDEVRLVPAGDPWQKRDVVVAAADARFCMAEIAIEGIAGLAVSRIEIDHDGPSVTADTLEAMTGPDDELFLILGADAAANMTSWRRLDDTRELATVVVVERKGEHAEAPGAGWRWMHLRIPRLDISSSEVRSRLSAGRPAIGLVPPRVLDYISHHDLYTPAR